ncbi:hypothetical protein M595_1378 [Lyngbya aestuarii BL J]|uniref:Uncharacterized protein n=1 Tax=Lyngbya aestuarii BL J TaxID=1348334 RepID=U7QMV4_9CYAN|nr:hypothetical protein M595_1378 [Lyngbya aestuarii BL J]
MRYSINLDLNSITNDQFSLVNMTHSSLMILIQQMLKP